MRRRRKIWYWVQVPGLMWCNRKRAWVHDYESLPEGGSNVKNFRTAARAFGHAEAMMDRGYEPHVMRIYWRKGRRLFREWSNVEFGPEMAEHNKTRYEQEHRGPDQAA
jgi:hypothetical protein